MKIVSKAFACSLMVTLAAFLCKAEDFGISQKIFDTKGLHTVFTFRHGELIHEVTIFFDPETKQHRNWIERFYVDDQPVFVRAGGARLISERYTGLSRVSVLQGRREGASPQRLSVGQESYDMGPEGFYHVLADLRSVLRESVIAEADFSSRTLDAERKKYTRRSSRQE